MMEEQQIIETKKIIEEYIKHYFRHIKLLEQLSGTVVLTEEIISSQKNLMESCKNTFLNTKFGIKKND